MLVALHRERRFLPVRISHVERRHVLNLLRVAGGQKQVDVAARFGLSVKERDGLRAALDGAVLELYALAAAVSGRIGRPDEDAYEVALRERHLHALWNRSIDDRRHVERLLALRWFARTHDPELSPYRRLVARVEVEPAVARAVGAHYHRVSAVNLHNPRSIRSALSPK